MRPVKLVKRLHKEKLTEIAKTRAMASASTGNLNAQLARLDRERLELEIEMYGDWAPKDRSQDDE
jgi:hypothetical protein